MEKIQAGFGVFAIFFLAWVTFRRKDINPIDLGKAFIWLMLSAFLIFMVPFVKFLLELFNTGFTTFVNSASDGNVFVFGALAKGDGPTGFILGFQVLPLVIFFSAISALLYKLKVIPIIIKFLGKLFKKVMGISGVEGFASAGSLFVGIEIGLFLKSYLKTVSKSELFLIITLMMSTVASTVMGVYTFILQEHFPGIAGHLLGASLITVPASVLICRLMMPAINDNGTYDTNKVELEDIYAEESCVEAFLSGTNDGVKLAVGIAATLIAVIGFKGVIDSFLLWSTSVSISSILNYIFSPFSFLLGVNPQARELISELLALRFTDTEVSAYIKLSQTLKENPTLLNASSKIAITYALCGFSHIPSFGIFAGGLSAILPERRKDFINLSLISLWSSFLVTLLTGCIARLFFIG